MATQIQLRRDTAANWTSVNPILAQGELGLELDTGREKVGDGSTAWNSLAYGGDSGSGGFPFTQSSPATTWTINHNLGFRPAVELFDTGGNVYEADISHPNNTQTVVTHVAPTAGSARLT